MDWTHKKYQNNKTRMISIEMLRRRGKSGTSWNDGLKRNMEREKKKTEKIRTRGEVKFIWANGKITVGFN